MDDVVPVAPVSDKGVAETNAGPIVGLFRQIGVDVLLISIR